MQKQSTGSQRAALAQAISGFHVAQRRARLHAQKWQSASVGLKEVIDEFWKIERLMPHPELVPEEVRTKGEAALVLCGDFNDRRAMLASDRHGRLRDALVELGVYYGSLMAIDTAGSLLTRFRTYLRAAIAEIFKLVVASTHKTQAAFCSWLRGCGTTLILSVRSGLRWTTSMRCQLRVWAFQRNGLL